MFVENYMKTSQVDGALVEAHRIVYFHDGKCGKVPKLDSRKEIQVP